MKLTDFPNEALATTNDDEARALLQELGLLAKLEAADKAALPGPSAARLNVYNHPTHWLCIIRYMGHADPQENGYAVQCLPKRQMSRAQFEQAMKAEEREDFPEGTTRQDDDLPPIGTN